MHTGLVRVVAMDAVSITVIRRVMSNVVPVETIVNLFVRNGAETETKTAESSVTSCRYGVIQSSQKLGNFSMY